MMILSKFHEPKRPLLLLSLVALLAITGCQSGADTNTTNSDGNSATEGVDSDKNKDKDKDKDEDKKDEGGSSSGGSGSGGSPVTSSDYRVLAANDLGMHCADKDYQIFSILPPFNVVHAQVVKTGKEPDILDDRTVEVTYHAVANPNDPVGPGSINTTSGNTASVFKTNFWERLNGGTIGGAGYSPLYPNGVLAGVEPIPVNLGLPAPDSAQLPALAATQQAMPGAGNQPQLFERFDRDVQFFAKFPFGSLLQGVDWFAADAIPMLPVDDKGRENAYPLMRISARDKQSKKVLATTDVVLPVASEADCQNCHADPDDYGNGLGSTFASVQFAVVKEVNAPGPEKLLNAAKINILRLHDAKHGAKYTSSVDGKPAVCDAATNPNDPNCLANQTPVQCSQCHYSPALDLAQVGPIDEPAQGKKGRQQTRHVSMSRAMHFTHGNFKDGSNKPVFPLMPTADDPKRAGVPKVNDFEIGILEDTCYQCHPGKRTQCLRGAMFTGGVVCQDCHGNMTQVGDDFSGGLPSGKGLDLAKRVPWASEPKCQSCHTGDALTPNHPVGAIVANDGLRLLQAWSKGDATAQPLTSPGSRFAENNSLYRLSGNKDGKDKGHNGVMCEGCHGSTHAIWPNANPLANDNVAASQLQGHVGAIVECDTCHTPGSLGVTLDGPHGMHPVGGTKFADGGHEDLAEKNGNACRSCHGRNGEGTVLSKVAADRSFVIEECENGTLCPGGERKNFTVTLSKGTKVTCNMCHKNKL